MWSEEIYVECPECKGEVKGTRYEDEEIIFAYCENCNLEFEVKLGGGK